ncbi:5-formyltetrahydrofolate cyclo-ligase [Alkalilacustris brevis]|uniref:5-formyltetrahydrofolate cyclo-ligase n=1 Tax=Alkalilacustris brevis TaxID=2026338 RepID=UPI001EE3EB10|nr:5-formyltetrahydrofolate cyclo-ligase [Alkalilacustris brevis]
MRLKQPELIAQKARMRVTAQARRAEAHAAVPAGAAAAVLADAVAPEAGRVLSGYMPMRSEADPIPAMAAHDGPVCVPVIAARNQPLRFRAWAPDALMQPGPFGAQVPVAGAWLTPEVLIVPLLAFDARGYRLGYGGGYYDRTLQALRASGGRVLAIGFAYAAQEVARVPVEPTDEPLDMIVTEDGLLHCR